MKAVDLTRGLSPDDALARGDLDHDIGQTRVESPARLIKDGKTLSDYGLQSSLFTAVLLDLGHKKSWETIDDEDLEAAEESAGLAVREGEIVLIRTGTDDPANFVTMSHNGAEYLEFKGAIALGVDAPSVDSLTRNSWEVHEILFQKGMFVIENLSNLETLEEARFRLLALPLALEVAVSPARVIALLGTTN